MLKNYFYFISLFILYSHNLIANPIIEWTGNESKLNLATYVEYIEDKSKSESLDTILKKFENGEGKKNLGESIGFGYSSSAFWLKWTIKSGKDQSLWLELVSLIDSIDFYTLKDNQIVAKLFTGRKLAITERFLKHRNFIFDVSLEKEKVYTLIFRFESQGSLLLPLTLWEKNSYLEEESLKTTLFGAYFGVMGVVFFYNLFLYLSIRDRSYLYYILYIFFLSFVQSGIWGYTHAYIFPEYPKLADYSFPISIGLVNTFAVLFAGKFVEARERMPRLNVYLKTIAILSAMIILPAFFGYYRISISIGLILTLVSSVTLFLISSYAWTKGYEQARFFLLGSFIVLIGAVIVGLRNFGILPYHFFTNYSLQFGSVFEAIFLSLSLADRINIIQKEKAALQIKSLEEQRSLTDSFSRFFPSQIIPLLNKSDVREVQLGDAVDGEVAVLFLDIRGFTSISEKLTPRLTFDFLNAFMRFTAPSIERKSGYIDKYIGDSIMAFFPKSSDNALSAANDMLIGLSEFNKKRIEAGETEIKIGIGIHYGKVLIGTIGQESRMDGTLIGDTVNTASRLEGKTKEVNSPILLSEVAYEKLSQENKLTLSPLGEMEIRGKEFSMKVYGLKN
ncbi:MAG: 7TM diverse intracellular signaling domain-containing protein [Leptospira sp.]|nr:7TM diverse intracellular signaling domain-containing protein [Leptospira sp.]